MIDAAKSLPVVCKREASDDDYQAGSDLKQPKIARMTKYNDSEDPIVQALMDASRANERAVAICKERMLTVRPKYYAGVETGQHPDIIEAYAHLERSFEALNAAVTEAAGMIESAPIYKLPSEIFLIAFGHMDTDSLLACQETCHLWRELLASGGGKKAVAASNNPTTLRGTLSEVSTKLSKIFKISASPDILHFKVYQSSQDKNLEEAELWSRFHKLVCPRKLPSQWLREFKYEGEVRLQDWTLWICVLQCPNLKLLHWLSMCPDRVQLNCEYGISTDHGLGKCKVEDFKFHSDQRMHMSQESSSIFDQVIRLQFGKGVKAEEQRAILAAGKQSLEHLIIDVLQDWNGASLTMEKLQTIAIKDRCIERPLMIAPQATAIHSLYGSMIHRDLLASCRHTMRSLHIEWDGAKTVYLLKQELFDMPALEILHLDYSLQASQSRSNDNNGEYIVDYRDFSSPALWDAVKHVDLTEMEDVLPSLKNLTIVHDPLLDEDLLLGFLNKRSLLGQAPLEKLVILLANHCSQKISRLEALRKTLPDFTYKCFKEWAGARIREWHIQTVFRLGGLYENGWAKLNAHKSVVENLHMNFSTLDVHRKSIEADPFDMPRLKTLELDFRSLRGHHKENTPEWTVKAFWDKMCSESNYHLNEGSHQKMLPDLHKFKVINDPGLDERRIIKLVAVRNRLGLDPIKTMTVYLSEECSREVDKLDSLIDTLPGFTYKSWDDWSNRSWNFLDLS